MTTPAFVGIDVAFSKGNRLPISVCRSENGKLIPLPLKKDKLLLPPRGRGNKLALVESEVESFSQEVLQYLRDIEREHRLHIEMIAIDAPRSHKKEGQERRECEKAMDKRGINCFATPSRNEFDEIIKKAERHLDGGGSESTLPHANQLWMLVGFSLFRVLGKAYTCIEVYPQAIVATLGCSSLHKTTPEGYGAQLESIARRTGWAAEDLEPNLAMMGFGAKHDKMDAFMSAWIASLPVVARKPCGDGLDDTIWVPKAT